MKEFLVVAAAVFSGMAIQGLEMPLDGTVASAGAASIFIWSFFLRRGATKEVAEEKGEGESV